MNQSQNNETDAIRSDIDVTRRRMDDTMDALGERLQPRHLLDEVLGYFRSGTADGDGKMHQIREKITHTADSAMHAVVDTVKKNPMPALLIGAGVAWMIYESRRPKYSAGQDGNYYGYSREGDELQYDPDVHYDRPLEYPPAMPAGTEGDWSADPAAGTSKLGQARDKLSEKASAATGAVKEKLSHVGEAARERAGALRQRAGELGVRMRDGTRQAYTATRQRVVTTADQHPLEMGLVALAAGVIAGLALPTPNVVNRSIGPTADKLRERAREGSHEMLEKGKRVAQAAVSAVKQEAEAQGLTPDLLRDKAAAVAERAKEATKDSARNEGFKAPGGNQSGSQLNDPSVARPTV